MLREGGRGGVGRDRVAGTPPSSCQTGWPLERPARSHSAVSTTPEDVGGELLGAVDLPEPVPEPLALQRVGADELIAQHACDDVLQDHARAAPRCERDALGALVGRDPEHPALAVGRAAEEPPPPRERRAGPGDRDPVALHVGDPHKKSSSTGSSASAESTTASASASASTPYGPVATATPAARPPARTRCRAACRRSRRSARAASRPPASARSGAGARAPRRRSRSRPGPPGTTTPIPARASLSRATRS